MDQKVSLRQKQLHHFTDKSKVFDWTRMNLAYCSQQAAFSIKTKCEKKVFHCWVQKSSFAAMKCVPMSVRQLGHPVVIRDAVGFDCEKVAWISSASSSFVTWKEIFSNVVGQHGARHSASWASEKWRKCSQWVLVVCKSQLVEINWGREKVLFLIIWDISNEKNDLQTINFERKIQKTTRLANNVWKKIAHPYVHVSSIVFCV